VVKATLSPKARNNRTHPVPILPPPEPEVENHVHTDLKAWAPNAFHEIGNALGIIKEVFH
jgi:hypothetical protein